MVPGFRFAGISAGIKKTGNNDLALIVSDRLSNVSGVFTTNRVKAAPVRLDIQRAKGSSQGRAVIINSGNANACTGMQGMKDAREMARITADELAIPSRHVYVASTGIIGQPLPMEKIRTAIPRAVRCLSPNSLPDAATAILTTDTFAKVVSQKVRISGKTGTVTGFAKGAGMVSPSMATMLCFIMTDIAVSPSALNALLRDAVSASFNRLVIDNDMSTNDTVLIMANGSLSNRPVRKNSREHCSLSRTLNDIVLDLARMIALDAEGASKLVTVRVSKASTVRTAETVARSIANSMLVKTALSGKSMNWGRIMAAIGYAGVPVNENKVTIHINNALLVKNGTGVNTRSKRKNPAGNNEVLIRVALNSGRKEAEIITCDLTGDYVKINADYAT